MFLKNNYFFNYSEEKSEQLSECREELEHTKLVLTKLRTDSQEWFTEARKAAGYRDEVDALREKAERCDRYDCNTSQITMNTLNIPAFFDQLKSNIKFLLHIT